MLHIRGRVAPIDVISTLCSALACRAYDIFSGTFIYSESENSFQKWKDFRDQVVNSVEGEGIKLNHGLGACKWQIKLKSGFLLKKPTGIDIYEQGIKIMFKDEEQIYFYEQLTAIRTSDYFVPNPINYHFDLFQGDKKIVSIAIPYVNREDGTQLLLAHKNAMLGSDFPENLSHKTYVLDHHLTWEEDKLVYSGRKGRIEYPASQIDNFMIKNGAHYFTLKNSKETLMVMLDYAPNCLMVIAICEAIAMLKE